MSTILLAIGLVLIVEGLAYALAPSLVERMLEALRSLPDGAIRQVGLLAVVSGLLALWGAFQLGWNPRALRRKRNLWLYGDPFDLGRTEYFQPSMQDAFTGQFIPMDPTLQAEFEAAAEDFRDIVSEKRRPPASRDRWGRGRTPRRPACSRGCDRPLPSTVSSSR